MNTKYVIRMLGSDYFMERATKRNSHISWGIFDKNTTIIMSSRTEVNRAARNCGLPCEIVEVFGV